MKSVSIDYILQERTPLVMVTHLFLLTIWNRTFNQETAENVVITGVKSNDNPRPIWAVFLRIIEPYLNSQGWDVFWNLTEVRSLIILINVDFLEINDNIIWINYCTCRTTIFGP